MIATPRCGRVHAKRRHVERARCFHLTHLSKINLSSDDLPYLPLAVFPHLVDCAGISENAWVVGPVLLIPRWALGSQAEQRTAMNAAPLKS